MNYLTLYNPKVIKKAEKHLQQTDQRLATIITKVGRCTLTPSMDNPFGVLVRSIINQQLSNKATDTIEKRLFDLIGFSTVTAEKVLGLTIEQLQSIGLSQAKSRAISTIAAAIHSGKLDWKILNQHSNEQVIHQLVNYPGIGEWTAQMFLIFALGRTDVLAVNDLGLRRAVQILYELPDKPTPTAFKQLSVPWQPYRTIASWYLWRVIDLGLTQRSL